MSIFPIGTPEVSGDKLRKQPYSHSRSTTVSQGSELSCWSGTRKSRTLPQNWWVSTRKSWTAWENQSWRGPSRQQVSVFSSMVVEYTTDVHPIGIVLDLNRSGDFRLRFPHWGKWIADFSNSEEQVWWEIQCFQLPLWLKTHLGAGNADTAAVGAIARSFVVQNCSTNESEFDIPSLKQ